MNKKEVFSELKKELGKSSDTLASDSSKTKEQQKNSETPSALFDQKSIDFERQKLLNQKKMLRRISLAAIIITLVGVLIFFAISYLVKPAYQINESALAASIYDPYGSNLFKGGSTVYITIKEVNEWKTFLESQNIKGTQLTEKEVLYQLIAYELLVSEAKQEGIRVSEEELDSLYDEYNKMTQFMLLKLLSEQNISNYEFKIYLENTLLIKKLFQKILTVNDVTEMEIDNFITENKDFIERQTQGKNITDAEIRNSVKLTIIDIKKEELQKTYIENLIENSEIKYYNKFAAMMN